MYEHKREIGLLIRNARIDARYSKSDLAREIGVTVPYVSMLESVKYGETPRPDVIDKIAKALRVTPKQRDKMYIAAGLLPSDMMSELKEVVRVWRLHQENPPN